MEVKDYIIYHSAGNLYWKDLDKRYLGCNKNYADILDLPSPHSIIGLADADIEKHQQLMSTDDIKKLTTIDDIVLQTGVTKVVEELGLNKDGEKAVYLTVKKPIKDADNNIIGLMGTSIDITPVKEVEKLKRHQEITNKLVKKLKTIAGSLSHEVRTPMAGVRMALTVVKTFFQNAKKNIGQITVELLAEQEKWIDKMIQRIDSGTALINIQLKNLSTEKVDTSRFYMNSVEHCIQDAINTFPFENQQVADKVHISIGKDFEFRGDALLTKHIIWNLLNNALHFIKETDRGEIFITTGQRGQQYFVSVKDTAKGMSPEQAKKVFEQFYTNREGGSGLGLSFCALVMESYGGVITCTAVEGEYAEFLLFFPIITAPDETMTPTGMVAKANT